MSNLTWKLDELLRSAGVTPLAGSQPAPVSITQLTDDSRKVVPGGCFVAVAGTKTDGARFVDQARLRGAAVIVGGPTLPAMEGVSTIRLPEPRESLSRLAAAFHRLNQDSSRQSLQLIGVTGTNGKTTITWLLRAILKAAGNRPAMLGTVEYDLVAERKPAPLTTPGAIELCESLARARDAGADYAVFEVSSHALDQRRCDGLNFAAGVFTNLTGDHLDYHENMDAYAAAKKRLFAMLPPKAAAVINADDPRGAEFAAATKATVVSYGIHAPSVDVRGVLQSVERTGTTFELQTRELRLPVRIPLVGTHNVANALASIATALHLGLSVESIVAGLQSISGVPGRLQRVEPDGTSFSVLVDYAHTDDALRNVLTALRPMTTGRLICVFGCGGDRDRGKRPRMAACVAQLADVAYVTSDNPRTEDPASIIGQIIAGIPRGTRCRVESNVDRRAAIYTAVQCARPGDTVLIAGKGHEDYQLVGDQVLHFDDVEVARDALAAREQNAENLVPEEAA